MAALRMPMWLCLWWLLFLTTFVGKVLAANTEEEDKEDSLHSNTCSIADASSTNCQQRVVDDDDDDDDDNSSGINKNVVVMEDDDNNDNNIVVVMDCQNDVDDAKCNFWAKIGECDTNPTYMHSACRFSCGLCSPSSSSSSSTNNNDNNDPRALLSCTDDHDACSYWSQLGECTNNPNYMHLYCQKSCGICTTTTTTTTTNEAETTTTTIPNNTHNQNGPEHCFDQHENCELWSGKGECDINPNYMHVNCRLSCMLCSNVIYSQEELRIGLDIGIAQRIHNLPKQYKHIPSDDIYQHIQQAREHRTTVDVVPPIKRGCLNEHEHCTIWALAGECKSNPDYMKQYCAPACQSCLYKTIEGRCPIDPKEPNAWNHPGDLNQMFLRITTEDYYTTRYNVQVLSSPKNYTNENDNNTAEDNDDDDDRPWVITMDNVLSQEEAQVLIEMGSNVGYKRSADVGKLRSDGTFESHVNNGRTSTNAWCRQECMDHPIVQNVTQRLSNITGIPDANSEFLQLLRYEPGQFYNVHHDYIHHEIKRQSGVRILTLYLYLNDVEKGGATNFDKLGISVEPKLGRALLWPSVLNEAPNEKDDRTTHQALPVEEGIKYGANAWFHMRDFKTPSNNNCH